MLSANFGVGNRSKMQNHCAYRSMMPIWYRALFCRQRCSVSIDQKGKSMKKALLVVSFGSTYQSAVEESIVPVEETLKHTFPDRSFFRAFGSRMIRGTLLRRDGVTIPGVSEAMDILLREGYGDVLIQPTYFIPGTEYTELLETVQQYAPRFGKLAVGKPLLNTMEDFREVIVGLERTFSLSEGEALVLMGHGTVHFANAAYPALEHIIQTTTPNRIFVGTVEGYPEIDDVIKKLRQANIQKVVLTAFMLVAGDHARNDMAGDDEDSWKSRLTREGFQVSCVIKGFGSYDFIRGIFADHALSAQ